MHSPAAVFLAPEVPVRVETFQAQGISYYRYGTEGHSSSCQHRREVTEGGYRDSQAVVNQRPEQVLFDVSHSGTAQFDAGPFLYPHLLIDLLYPASLLTGLLRKGQIRPFSFYG